MPQNVVSRRRRNKTARSAPTARTPKSEADTAHKRPSDRIESSLLKFDKLPAAAHVKVPVVAALYGISTASVWRWAGSGHLPAPVKLGPQATGWNVGELRAHLAARRAGE